MKKLVNLLKITPLIYINPHISYFLKNFNNKTKNIPDGSLDYTEKTLKSTNKNNSKSYSFYHNNIILYTFFRTSNKIKLFSI